MAQKPNRHAPGHPPEHHWDQHDNARGTVACQLRVRQLQDSLVQITHTRQPRQREDEEENPELMETCVASSMLQALCCQLTTQLWRREAGQWRAAPPACDKRGDQQRKTHAEATRMLD